MFKVLAALSVVVLGGSCVLVKERVTGGSPSPDTSAPYQVSLRTVDTGYHFCSGGIYNKQYVLTTASCATAEPSSNIQVLVGSHRLSEGGSWYDVASVITHKQYDSELGLNDIALIKVTTDIILSSSAQKMNLTQNSVGTSVTVIIRGWGLTTPRFPASFPNDLREAKLATISNAACAAVLPTFLVVKQHLCTLGSSGQAACIGDHGSPLTLDRDGSVVGIVSRIELPCGNKPDVSVRISEYYNWTIANAI